MKIFAANFKMNKTQKETKEYFEKFDANQKGCRMMFALPFTSLVAAKKHPNNAPAQWTLDGCFCYYIAFIEMTLLIISW